MSDPSSKTTSSSARAAASAAGSLRPSPRPAPRWCVGRPAVRAYAARAGQSVEAYLQTQGSLVRPEIAGTALVELVQADAATVAPLTG